MPATATAPKQTRRQKVAAMAAQTASPAEAEVAKAMLATISPEPADALATIATDILSIAKRTIDDEFAIGRLLTQAAELLDPMARKRDADGKQSGSEFTDWFNAQGFPFSMKTARRLRIAVEREPEVRALIDGKVGRDMGVNTAVAQLLAGPKEGVTAGELLPVEDTTPPNPAYAALRQAHLLIVEKGGFADMHVDDLAKSAAYIKGLASAYNEAKAGRSA